MASSQRIDCRAGEFSLRFPLIFNPRYHMHERAQPGDTRIATPQVFADDNAAPPRRTHIAAQLDAGMPLAGLTW